MLTIMLEVYRKNARVPQKQPDFYMYAFSVLYQQHDARKDVFRREILSKLEFLDFQNLFAYLSYHSYFGINSDEFTQQELLTIIRNAKEDKIIDDPVDEDKFLRDLIDSVCVLTQDDIKYRFIHRSFQQFYAAQYTSLYDENMNKTEKKFVQMHFGSSSIYIDSLYRITKTRFYYNVLYPGWCEIKEIAKNCNDSHLGLLLKIYSSVSVTGLNNSGYKLNPKNVYLHFILTYSCKVLKHAKPRRTALQTDFAKEIAARYSSQRFVTFSLLESEIDNIWDRFISTLSWLYDEFDFLLKNIDLYEARLKMRHII